MSLFFNLIDLRKKTMLLGIFFIALNMLIYAEVVTFVAGSLEAGGLPGYPEVFQLLK